MLLALLAVLALAVAPQKQVIVSYPKDTPTSVVEEAMDAIRKAVCSLFSAEGYSPAADANIGWRHRARVQFDQGVCCEGAGEGS